ncbi:hypothetical protein BC937DRAFT_93371 [Endogone sp. FLAS-F59071]|nr:hypothetical protein BC937DRAFT_93371 [Endogone sp. FLAS-F59071]|eukprot:RUS14766.1 hypothetical protein BC937DRAFT_93371 [Endogone sp. FLAS-F59071]
MSSSRHSYTSRRTRRSLYLIVITITLILLVTYGLLEPNDDGEDNPFADPEPIELQDDDTTAEVPEYTLFTDDSLNMVQSKPIKPTKSTKYVPEIVDSLTDPSSTEMYLTYLPHSGFSNQRTELVNALLMASYLNRTLIVPPAFLGEISGWRIDSGLHAYWEKMTAGRLNDLCSGDAASIELANTVQPVTTDDCAAYKAFAMIPWSHLVDFGTLLPQIRVVERREISLPLLKQQLGLSNRDIYRVVEKMQYDWILFDKKSNFKHPKYRLSLSLHDFQNKKHRLIHLYSTFGSGRVRFATPEHNKLREHIINSLIYRHDVVEDIAAKIVARMGGQGNYIGMHIRMGHVLFQRVLQQTMDKMLKSLGKETGYAPQKDEEEAAAAAADFELLKIDQKAHIDAAGDEDEYHANEHTDEPDHEFEPDHDAVSLVDVHTLPPSPSPAPLIPLLICLRLAAGSPRGRHSLIYVATDSRNPRADPFISRLFRRYPCTFALVDLDNHHELLAPLREVRSPLDSGKDLTKFLIPLVDAMVAAQGRQFFPSPGSTFSGYIGMVHRQWIEAARKQ